MSQYTKEPWIYSHHANGVPYVFAEHHNRQTIATAYGDFDEANARRIVACVNACAGIPNEALEAFNDWSKAGVASCATYKAQRDELLAALQAVVAVWDDIYPDMESGKYPQERLEYSELTEMQAAREAIAKAVQP